MRKQNVFLLRVQFVFILFLAALAIAGCDDGVKVDSNPTIPIRAGATWSWGIHAGSMNKEAKEEPMLDNQITRGRIKQSIADSLAAKGLREVANPEEADFIVHYHVGISNQTASVAQTVPGRHARPVLVCNAFACWQTWQWGYWGPPEVIGYHTVNYKEGTLMIDIVQRSSDQLAWRGVNTGAVENGTPSASDITKGVNRLLRDLKVAK